MAWHLLVVFAGPGILTEGSWRALEASLLKRPQVSEESYVAGINNQHPVPGAHGNGINMMTSEPPKTQHPATALN